VSPKHPDKLCDQISDAILDAYLSQDPHARVAAETCGGHGVVFVTGEITSIAKDIDIEAIVHRIAGEDMEVHTKKGIMNYENGRDYNGFHYPDETMEMDKVRGHFYKRFKRKDRFFIRDQRIRSDTLSECISNCNRTGEGDSG
jgi:hypothetical protein